MIKLYGLNRLKKVKRPNLQLQKKSQKKNRSGFTLIELSIVIMLFALLATISMANVSFLHRMAVRTELENLYVACSVLQRSAMMLGKEQRLQCDRNSNSYRYNNSVHKLPSSVCFGTASGVKGPPSSPDFPVTNPVTFKDSTIIFYPDGIIQSGAIYLTDNRKRCTYALSCAVSKVSYLRKYQYTNKWDLLG